MSKGQHGNKEAKKPKKVAPTPQPASPGKSQPGVAGTVPPERPAKRY